MVTLFKFIHLLSIVVWIGSVVFFSFFAAPSIFKVLPRETAGDVVGDIFPKYWIINYFCSLVALFTLLGLSLMEGVFPFLRVAVLAALTLLVFYSGIFIGSEARDVKARMKAVEDRAEREKMREEFKRLHRKSSTMNMVVLTVGLIFIWLTAAGISL
ncbi:MAG: DUF4149 domain-containing protein [Thermodesulfobacteriota bacterium]